MTKNIKQTIYFDALALDVYEALIDAKKHVEFTGASASIDRKVGGEFSVWDGYATGENKELVQDKLIVQTWRASDWPEDAESTVKFEFIAKNGKTKLVFTQTEVPHDFVEDVANGWKDFYWQPLKDYLANH